jgi:RNA polymerase sigma-70 factor (ECF subfamily)
MRRAVRPEVGLDEASEEVSEAGDPPAAADPVDLERAVLGLAPGFRDVLVLHDVEGFTHAEIGELLGIQIGTSKSQLARARRVLRNALTDKREVGHAGRS